MGLQLGHRREVARFDGLEQRTATAVADDVATNVEITQLLQPAAGRHRGERPDAAVADAVANEAERAQFLAVRQPRTKLDQLSDAPLQASKLKHARAANHLARRRRVQVRHQLRVRTIREA
eukprot:CAMPEP_0202777602 /NCGR_PEP_ID=MMETSP1388-20130828/52991_1 /ASSEMBLY_ACC=CAM_ASM_000864 /TAXON_ID=37098 /ORGANISM="Isochrysis sp, Strain CCMP1244" /LENGTH=120 /DNA_ID=CAMNT_0049446843 /DNA_START=133 /DNA_END=492 /DNA_ORIENTATION=+